MEGIPISLSIRLTYYWTYTEDANNYCITIFFQANSISVFSDMSANHARHFLVQSSTSNLRIQLSSIQEKVYVFIVRYCNYVPLLTYHTVAALLLSIELSPSMHFQ